MANVKEYSSSENNHGQLRLRKPIVSVYCLVSFRGTNFWVISCFFFFVFCLFFLTSVIESIEVKNRNKLNRNFKVRKSCIKLNLLFQECYEYIDQFRFWKSSRGLKTNCVQVVHVFRNWKGIQLSWNAHETNEVNYSTDSWMVTMLNRPWTCSRPTCCAWQLEIKLTFSSLFI